MSHRIGCSICPQPASWVGTGRDGDLYCDEHRSRALFGVLPYRVSGGVPEQVFVELYDLELPGADGVLRRENMTDATDDERVALARHFAARVDREYHGVRIARYAITQVQEF